MGSEPRTGALDGLRGLAALSVVGFHVWLYRPDRVTGERTEFGDRVFFELHLGLICFFVLSGFLLYRGLLRRPDFSGTRCGESRGSCPPTTSRSPAA